MNMAAGGAERAYQDEYYDGMSVIELLRAFLLGCVVKGLSSVFLMLALCFLLRLFPFCVATDAVWISLFAHLSNPK